MTNMKEVQELGYERPTAGNMVAGGSRAVSMWGVAIVGSLKKAMHDPRLLDRMAGDLRPGDHVFLAAYATTQHFQREERTEVGQVLVLAVTKPPAGKREGGRVTYRVMAHMDIATELAKLTVAAA